MSDIHHVNPRTLTVNETKKKIKPKKKEEKKRGKNLKKQIKNKEKKSTDCIRCVWRGYAPNRIIFKNDVERHVSDLHAHDAKEEL
jgi:hypothetical protein